jgi:large subunit ribosomal protein L4
MATLTLKNPTGADAGTIELSDDLFGVQPNVPLMHQVVTAQLAARRSGTQSTKTRADVRGGGAKPYRQKGTGNARQGSIRSPQFTGGGVALGPKPRKYGQKTPKKMIKAALRSALSDRAGEDRIVVVDSWGIESPKTKDAKAILDALGIEGTVLVVVGRDDTAAALSFRNLPHVQTIAPEELNAYDVLCNDWIVFTKNTLPAANAPAKGRAVEEPAVAQDEPAVEAEPAIAQVEPAVEEPAVAQDEPAVEAEPAVAQVEPAVEAEPAVAQDEPAVEAEPAIAQDEPAVEAEPAVAQDEPAVEDEPATEKDES